MEKIGGWLTRKEGILLYSLAKRVKKENVIVEIGSWKGKSTICLGGGTKSGNQVIVYAIDPHTGSFEHRMFREVDTFEEFRENVKNAGVDQYIKPIRKTSEDASRFFQKPVEFIFIDGAHGFKSVRLDFQLWFPKVINKGIVAFHDSWGFLTVNIATAIILLTSSKIKNPKLVDTITYFEKVERNSLIDRIRNIYFLIFRTFFGIKGLNEIARRGSKL